MTPGRQPLLSLLTELAEIVPASDRGLVTELQRRIAERLLRVLVVGEAKRGKSTLVNALCRQDVLPTGVVPLTAVATTLRHGTAPQLTATFVNGSRRAFPVADLPLVVTETGNPGNRKGLAEVTLTLPAAVLAKGVELVDTPGVGSVYEHNTDAAHAAIGQMDAAIVVLTADPPISAAELAFLRKVDSAALAVFCVLNKADRLAPDELAAAQAFVVAVLRSELGREVEVFPMSARAARAGRDGGFGAFERAFLTYLDHHAAADLVSSVARRATGLATSLADAHQALLAAWSASEEDLRDRLRLFERTLEDVATDRGQALAAAGGELRRLRRETDEQAARLLATAAPTLVAEVARHLDTVAADAATVERAGAAYLVRRVEAIVEDWRRRRSSELDAAVRALDERLAERLTAQIQHVRDAANLLLPIALPAWPATAGLAGEAEVRYTVTPDPGQLEALATVVRQHLPGHWGRQRAIRHVAASAPPLLDKHLGRTRAAFQELLERTERQLRGELARRFDDGAGRIAIAITAAATRRDRQQQFLQSEERSGAEEVLRRAHQLVKELHALAEGTPTEGGRPRRGTAVA